MYKVPEVKNADLVIVDLSVNDQGFPLQSLPYLYETFIQLIDKQDNHPAIMFNYAFRTAKYDKKDIGYHCADHGNGECCNGYVYCKRYYDYYYY